MSETEMEIDEAKGKNLRLKSAAEIEGPDGEDHGRVYSEMLRQLQINPPVQQDWFTQNLKTIRNKKWARNLLARGDTDSLNTLSNKCLTALGNLTWSAGNRQWLIPQEQLDEGEQPLIYKPPGQRRNGDHDRFFPPMEAMWREMRSRIFAVKAVSATKAAAGVESIVRKKAPPRRKQTAYTMSTHNFICQPVPASPNEMVPPGKWSETQSEEAIFHIIRNLNDARLNSDEEVFERVVKRFMARLIEIEYVDDLDIPEREVQEEQNGQETAATPDISVMNDDDNMELDQDESSIDELQADQYSQPRLHKSHTKASLTPKSNEKQNSPMMTLAQAINSPPSGSLRSYLRVTYPESISAYITPYSSSTAAAPYSWVDAPCLPSSYSQFVHGIRLRANVPGSVSDKNLVIILAYGWSDFCRVLKNEEDWKEGFQKDIRLAAERDRVDVWRIRVCCFA